MKRSLHLALSLVLGTLIATGAGASAREPLRENSYVTERLVAARVADRIRKTCPEIGARLIHAFSEAHALKAWAEKQGYTAEEIDRFLKDKAEKRTIYARAEAYLAAKGATPGNVQGFCDLGRKEIAAHSIVGSLIYEK